MAEAPLITFKAGKCSVQGNRIISVDRPGYIYVFYEDELPHFCWRPRSSPAAEPETDLTLVPGDATFVPWLKEEGADELHSPTNGRIYVLQLQSSSQKWWFWLQSKTQHSGGDDSWWSERDQRIGQVVNAILQGEEVDVEGEIQEIRNHRNGGGGQADEMDVDEPEPGTGGAGAGATGGDPREEGEASREGGADGGRATEAESSLLVQNFLRSLQHPNQRNEQEQPFTTLPDLLTTTNTIPFLRTASTKQIDKLCSLLPPDIFILAQESETTPTVDEPVSTTPADATSAIEALSRHQKEEIITRVLRSPQLHQSLGSLTIALRDGGLPMIGEALGLSVENGGLIRGGSMPLGGNNAVRAFVEGVKRTVEKEKEQEDGGNAQ